jgi:hypothetical protein
MISITIWLEIIVIFRIEKLSFNVEKGLRLVVKGLISFFVNSILIKSSEKYIYKDGNNYEK